MGPKPMEERSDHDPFRTELVNLIALADCGYRGVEPMIEHVKADGLLGKTGSSAKGYASHALLCGAWHNLRIILRHLQVLYCALHGLIAWASLLLWQLLTSSWPLNESAAGQITRQRA